MNSIIPDIDNCCEKETYAFFRLAAYAAQILEHSALNLAIVLRLPEIDLVSQELFDNLYESLGKRTFGQLIRATKGEIKLSESDKSFLEETLELRNMLVHHYFRERAEDFISESGRIEIKQELQLIISKFKQADQIMEALYKPLWEQYGVTQQFIEQELEKMRMRLKQRDGRA